MRENIPTHICPMRNWQLFLILVIISYSKCKYILHMLNTYKILQKKHQVIDR